jgi:hypothetical protein
MGSDNILLAESERIEFIIKRTGLETLLKRTFPKV